MHWRSEAGKLWVAGSWDSCAYNGVSGLCQSAQLKFNSSGSFSLHSDIWEEQRWETGSERGMEEQRDRTLGFDCTGCSDKATGKGRMGQGDGRSWLGLLLPQEELTHPSDHLPHLWRPRSDSVTQCHQPGVGNWSPEPQIELNINRCRITSTATLYIKLLYWWFYMFWTKKYKYVS